MSVSRTYNSPLREEQMEQTRERILEAMAEFLANEHVGEITVASVAEHARISTRTAYRYFPTKDALLDAFNLWMRKRFGSPPNPTSVANLPDNAAELVHYFGANEQLMRASRTLPQRELRKRRKVEQVRVMTKITADAAPHLDADTIRLRAAAMHQILGSEGWMNLRDHWGLTQEETIAAVQWALRTLGEQLLADDLKAKKRK